jgi:hypothetical protein
MLRVDGREEGDGQPEHRGVEVDQERPGQRLAASDEADSLGDCARSRADGAGMWRHGRQPGHP